MWIRVLIRVFKINYLKTVCYAVFLFAPSLRIGRYRKQKKRYIYKRGIVFDMRPRALCRFFFFHTFIGSLIFDTII